MFVSSPLDLGVEASEWAARGAGGRIRVFNEDQGLRGLGKGARILAGVGGGAPTLSAPLPLSPVRGGPLTDPAEVWAGGGNNGCPSSPWATRTQTGPARAAHSAATEQ